MRIVIKVASPRQLVCDYTAPAHFPGPPLHVHPGFDETYLVIAGRLQVQIGDDITDLDAGATAYVDGDVPHTFAHPGSDPVRFLSVCSPGGFEDFFRAVAAGDEAAIAAASERSATRRSPEKEPRCQRLEDRADSLPVPVGHRRLVVVLFLRRAGCPFAEAAVIAAREAAARQPDVDFVAVSHTSMQSTDTWCSAIGAPIACVSSPIRHARAARPGSCTAHSG